MIDQVSLMRAQFVTLAPAKERAMRMNGERIVGRCIVMAGIALRGTSIPFEERIAWIPAVLVVVTLNAFLWSGATAFMRAGSESYLMSVLVLLGSRAKYATYAAVPVTGLWLLTVGSQLAKG